MVNYNSIFLQKIGQFEAVNPWDDTKIQGFLDSSAYIASIKYATPWADFDSVPGAYQYAVTLFAAIQYWWAKAGDSASKFDVQVGGGAAVQKSTQVFYRALEMIKQLKEELEELAVLLDDESTGDIIVGDMVKRSKFSGYLVPRAADPAGNWTS